MAAALVWAGRSREALVHVEEAMRLDPHYPPSYSYVLGLAHFGMGKLREAATQFEIVMKRNPQDLQTLIPLTAAYAVSGQTEQAKAAFNKYLEPRGGSVDTLGTGHITDLGVRFYLRTLPFRDAQAAKNLGDGLIKIGVCCQEDVEEFIDRMRKKGLLE